jgi:cation diffusion facilitator family transporter
VVASLTISAGYTLYEAISRFIHPAPFHNLGWVALASLVGFVGNETIALMQIRVGRQIGSATMVADGLHTRTDGFASLAVLVAVAGTWLGYPIVDPLIGFVIGITIVVIAVDACKMIWYRLMDAVDPTFVTQIHTTVATVALVQQVGAVRVRWHGENYSANSKPPFLPLSPSSKATWCALRFVPPFINTTPKWRPS